MKLNIDRDSLLGPLQTVIGVIERKHAMPILANVLINAENSNLSVIGTDMELELIGSSILAQSLAEKVSLTLPARKLMDICKSLPDNAPIELQQQENSHFILKSGRSRFSLASLPTTEFPNIEKYESAFSFSLTQSKLRRALQHTYFSMAQQDVRYFLNGMLWEIFPEHLKLFATDTHRVASSQLEISHYSTASSDSPPLSCPRIIVPRKGVMELLRLLEDNDEIVTIYVGNNHIRITNTNYTLTSKLIDGRFPNIERMMPQNAGKALLLNRTELKEAMQRVAILCNEKFHAVRIQLQTGVLRLFADNPENETAEEEILIDYEGENIESGANITYLLDILNCLQHGQIKLTLNALDNSIHIEENIPSANSSFIVMPMRL